jgi:hypothetical protein
MKIPLLLVLLFINNHIFDSCIIKETFILNFSYLNLIKSTRFWYLR